MQETGQWLLCILPGRLIVYTDGTTGAKLKKNGHKEIEMEKYQNLCKQKNSCEYYGNCDNRELCPLQKKPAYEFLRRDTHERVPSKKTYEDGLREAWGIVKRIVTPEENGGFSNSELKEIFGSYYYSDVFKIYDIEQAKAKIEAWENEKNKIEKGDIVIDPDGKERIVIFVDDFTKLSQIYIGDGVIHVKTDLLKKTGKHVDIDKLFRQNGA